MFQLMVSGVGSGIIGSGGGVFILRGLRAMVFFGATVFFGAGFFAATAFLGAAFLAAAVVVFFGAAFFAVVVFFGAAAFFGVAFFTGVFFGAALAVVFLAAVFFATGFLAATAFFGAAFLAAGFFTAAFLTAGFFTAAFLAVGFFAAGFFAAGFLAAVFLTAAFIASGWARRVVSSVVTRLAPWLMVERIPVCFESSTRQRGQMLQTNCLRRVFKMRRRFYLCPLPMRPKRRCAAGQVFVTVHDRPSFCVRCLLTDTVLTRLRRESRDARKNRYSSSAMVLSTKSVRTRIDSNIYFALDAKKSISRRIFTFANAQLSDKFPKTK